MTETYRLIGAVPSPYSMKMRAILRYRRVPFIFDRIGDHNAAELAGIKPPTMPYLVYPDGTIRNDTTQLAYDLERRLTDGRSLLPGDPATDFIVHLLEDFGDEWGTRIMAHYRWNYEEDQDFCGRWIGTELNVGKSATDKQAAGEGFRSRQVGRRDLLGVSLENQPVLEASYLAVLAAFTDMLATSEFLFGSRPSLADFGWFGQLFQMTVDPVSQDIMRTQAPDVLMWLLRLDDASGTDGEWHAPDQIISPTVARLLTLAGKTYLPLLVANAAAAQAEQPTCRIDLDGSAYVQATNRYHIKCLAWLREEFDALDSDARSRAASYLDASGCLPFFSERPA